MRTVMVIGTYDTKAIELEFVARRIREMGGTTRTVDVSSLPHTGGKADVSNVTVAAYHPVRQGFLGTTETRGEAVTLMAEALASFLGAQTNIGGVIGIGGSGNTALVTHAMRTLPIGVPKVMVSTVASGDVAPYVGPNDIMMVYSVTDIAGLNRVSRTVLANAAHAIAGMAKDGAADQYDTTTRKTAGMTMFGVTTPCVTAVRERLEGDYDVLVFHATGTGGQSMEKLIDSGMIDHVVDVTLTEVCDLHMGGVMSAGEDRMGAVIRRQIPYVGSVGALDMVNFAAYETVPAHYQGRTLYRHNANVTLMRTTVEENARMGGWIAAKLNQMDAPVRFLLPTGGVSMIDAPGQPFYDPDADEALFQAIEKQVVQTETRRVVRVAHNINDAPFAEALIHAFQEVYQWKPQPA